MAGILQGFLGLLMIKVETHVSVGTQTDFCKDITRLTDEHGISTVVFPWDARTSHRSTQLTRVERLMETTQSQVSTATRTAAAVFLDFDSGGGGGLRIVEGGTRSMMNSFGFRGTAFLSAGDFVGFLGDRL